MAADDPAADPSAAPDSPEALAALAAEPLDDDDLALLQSIAALHSAADPVPDRLVERVSFAITLDALEAELAELVREPDLAGVRSSGSDGSYSITFAAASTTIMLTVSQQSADVVRVDGWVSPGAHVAVDIRSIDSVLTTVADEDGRFVFEQVPRGFAQFIVRPGDDALARSVITPALEL